MLGRAAPITAGRANKPRADASVLVAEDTDLAGWPRLLHEEGIAFLAAELFPGLVLRCRAVPGVIRASRLAGAVGSMSVHAQFGRRAA